MVMDKIHDAVAWYQTKIGSYDKQLWEQSVEQKLLRGLRHIPRKNVVRQNTDLIDVDLIRGSTFTKTKPQVPWTNTTRKALLRLIFLPFYSKWWVQQTSVKFWLFLMLLYLLQVGTMILFFVYSGDKITRDESVLSQVMIPNILMVVLGLIHSQTILSHFSHKPPSREKKYNTRSSSSKSRKRRSQAQNAQIQRSNSPKNARGTPKESQTSRVEAKNCQECNGTTGLRKKCLKGCDGKSGVNGHSSSSGISKHISFKDIPLKSKNKYDSESQNQEKSSNSSDLSDREDFSFDNSLIISDGLDVLEGQNGAFEILTLENNLKLDSACSSQESGKCDTLSTMDYCINHELVDDGSKKNNRKFDSEDSVNGKVCDTKNIVETLSPASFDETGASSVNDSSNVFSEENQSPASHTDSQNTDSQVNTLNSKTEGKHNSKTTKSVSSEEDQSIICDPSNRIPPQFSITPEHTSDISNNSQQETDANSDTFGLRKRKVAGSNESQKEMGSKSRTIPENLTMTSERLKEVTGISSSEGETAPSTPNGSKNTLASDDWEDRMQSDLTTSSAYSTSSESEVSDNEGQKGNKDEENPSTGLPMTASNLHVINLLQPPTSSSTNTSFAPPDKISCIIWERNECKKVDLTALDVGWAIIDKVDNIPESSDYIIIGIAFSLIISFVPITFQAFHHTKDFPMFTLDGLIKLWQLLADNALITNMILLNGMFQRLCLSCVFFFLLSVTERTFKQRLLYAKHFCYLTSSRRARKFDMPHFRLNKVRNIKTWLSLRSYLKKRGPQRSVDVILSSAFLMAIICVTLICLQLLKDTETFLDFLCNWELLIWCLALGLYLLRFMTLGLKINKKYRNLSVLITEQINLYLQMELKPHKKEELMLANNVLKLAEELIKELESPFKISGMSANPFVYNVMKVVVLSAFSAVLSELLGFKLKLYKIKLKA